MPRERWLPCAAPYGSLYLVSDWGRVRRRDSGRILKPSSTNGGLTVRLCIEGKAKTFRVHRLVAFAFIPSMTDDAKVRHIDGDVTNNRVSNLSVRPRRTKKIEPPQGRHRDLARGTAHHAAKLDPEQVAEVRELFDAGVNRREIAEQFGISRQWVQTLGRGEGWVSKEHLHQLILSESCDPDEGEAESVEATARKLGLDLSHLLSADEGGT